MGGGRGGEQDVFTGGAREGAGRSSREAGYDAAVATYRDVGAARVRRGRRRPRPASRCSHEAGASQADAVDAASRARSTSPPTATPAASLTSLDVVSAQQTLLGNQRLAAQIQGERLVTTVELVKALGGGWTASALDAIK